ncbi:MAG TPA: hydroxyisourate hydrolase [Nocardioidaceae bacterium]|nr:hydroxyisourate hydrolase [Nocardioidaceae bacterium]
MTLSSHVLDASTGTPAAGVAVTWQRLDTAQWTDVAEARTDDDGRIGDWRSLPTPAGRHRLVFDSGGYFDERGVDTFYPQVVVVFEVADPEQHFHVPLLLSPFAYSTYRGS